MSKRAVFWMIVLIALSWAMAAAVARADVHDDCSGAFQASDWSRASVTCEIAAGDSQAQADEILAEQQEYSSRPRVDETALFWDDRLLQGLELTQAGIAQSHFDKTDGHYLLVRACGTLMAVAQSGTSVAPDARQAIADYPELRSFCPPRLE